MSALDDMIDLCGRGDMVHDSIIDDARAELAALRAKAAEHDASALGDKWRIVPDENGDGGETWRAAFADCDMQKMSAEARIAALEAAVNEARELLTTLEWNDWDESVDAWLAAHPAVTPEQFGRDF